MKHLLLAAAATAIIASPAMARNGQPYVGVEGGLIIDGQLDQDVRIDDGFDTTTYDDAFKLDLGSGLDIDVIGGYDFGMFRLEGELGYKKLNGDKVKFGNEFADDFFFVDTDDFDVDTDGHVVSGMINGLVDFGNEDGLSFFAGAGLGRAGVKIEGDKDSAFAWQLLAGMRYAVSPNVDVGLKYRYFRTGKLNFSDDFDDGETVYGIDGRGHLQTHSLLASLIFNFGSPAVEALPPAPVVTPAPEPVAPATQTCADGSVILATDMCPAPPPPAPVPERG